MKMLITCVALGLTVCSVSGTALAESTPAGRSVAVRYADLDKNSSAGARVLYGRLHAAAEAVCEDLRPELGPRMYYAHARCVRSALQEAIVRIDSPALKAFAAVHDVGVRGQSVVASR